VPWVNDDMVLYHGCSDLSLHPANPDGIFVSGAAHNISHTASAARSDFGPGFYATTWLHQARNWANARAIKLRPRHPSVRAVVLCMHVARNKFAGLQSLVFPSDRDNFFTFVRYCRGGGVPHAALEHRDKPYDVVAGPVSITSKQTLVIGGADQVSFHTAAATATIDKVSVIEVGTPYFDVST
jgi:hypothetical protein